MPGYSREEEDGEDENREAGNQVENEIVGEAKEHHG